MSKAAEKARVKELEYYRRRYPESYLMYKNMKTIAEHHGLTMEELAKVAKMSPRTMKRRREEPFRFLDAEVIDICRLLGVTPAQIRVEPVYPMPVLEVT